MTATKIDGEVVNLDNDPVAPVLGESLEAFRRDLPELLKTHRGKWVAHRGQQQIGIAQTAATLYQHCFRRGLKDHEFLVSHISPEIPDKEGHSTLSIGIMPPHHLIRLMRACRRRHALGVVATGER